MTVQVAGHPLTLDPRLAWTAVRGEVVSLPSPLKRWLGFLGLLVAFGAAGAALTIPPGDEVFGTTPTFEWGVLIAAYVFLVTTTSGLCLVSALGQVFGVESLKPVAKRAVVLALAFLLAGFVVIGLDLHYPVRLIFGVVLSPSPSSAMWWMGVLYSIYLVFLLVELFGMLAGFERIAKAGSALCLVTAIAAPSTLGAVFGFLGSRPWWNESLVPIYMVLTAALSGTAILGIVFSVVDRPGIARRGHGLSAADHAAVLPAIRRLLTLAIGLVAAYTAWQIAVALTSANPGAHGAAMAQLAGPLSLHFWLVKVGIGLVAPFALLTLRGRIDRTVVLPAAILAMIGLFADRLDFVSAGQIAPTTVASGTASAPWAAYTPSLVEIAIVAGAIGLVGVMYTLAERFLDLSEHAHETAPQAAEGGLAATAATATARLGLAGRRLRAGRRPAIAMTEAAPATATAIAAEAATATATATAEAAAPDTASGPTLGMAAPAEPASEIADTTATRPAGAPAIEMATDAGAPRPVVPAPFAVAFATDGHAALDPAHPAPASPAADRRLDDMLPARPADIAHPEGALP